MVDQKYIGIDPVAWVERLIEVNNGSGFTTEQKIIIDRELRFLRLQLQSDNPA